MVKTITKQGNSILHSFINIKKSPTFLKKQNVTIYYILLQPLGMLKSSNSTKNMGKFSKDTPLSKIKQNLNRTFVHYKKKYCSFPPPHVMTIV
jgi:hypothetical protein